MADTYALTGADGPIGRLIAESLGSTLTLEGLDDSALVSRASVEDGLSGLGRLGGVIHGFVPEAVTGSTDIAETSDAEWDERCELVIRSTINVLQGAYTALKDTGGVVIVTLPTVGLSGQRHFAAYAAACEAQRTLVKGAARAWGAVGIRVHSVVFGPELLGGEIAEIAPKESLLLERALPDHPVDSWGGDIASAIEFLVGPGAEGLTGTTVSVDSGRWMPL